MTDTIRSRWEHFKKSYLHFPEAGFSLDVSCMQFDEGFFERMETTVQRAFVEMAELERGAIANKDENRMVGHYWLRNPDLAPTREMAATIEMTISRIEGFAAAVHAGKVAGAGGPFRRLLVIGIGGSALGPQFVSRALACPGKRRMELHFIDNTDPDGIDHAMADIGGDLSITLCLVISKSGGTKETRNGMLEVKQHFESKGLRFEDQAVAITGEGSELDKVAAFGKWLERFPMWDWVGGRTSELSAVGLLPAALQGIAIRELLRGAAACDHVTRERKTQKNPAALMALAWHASGNGKGTKDMVVLPYKDRLELLSKYLQQLIMESLGKANDRSNNVVRQGLAVYGNKGSTDQHAYVQQLRDGLDNFFVTFVSVLKDRESDGLQVEPGITTGDYLNGFYLGTRSALFDNGRQSISVTVLEVREFSVGVLIALFERAVGLYASMVDINAYHQPGVEAGKKAAAEVLKIQARVLAVLGESPGEALNTEQVAARLGDEVDLSEVFLVCRHLAATRKQIAEELKDPIWNSTFRSA